MHDSQISSSKHGRYGPAQHDRPQYHQITDISPHAEEVEAFEEVLGGDPCALGTTAVKPQVETIGRKRR